MKNLRLLEIQDELDSNFAEYTKKEFDLHYTNYLQIKPLLNERDKVINKIPKFWSQVLNKTELGQDSVCINYDIISYIFACYDSEYWCTVEIGLNINEYTDAKVLKKRFNVASEEVDFVANEFKTCEDNALFSFFRDEEVDLGLFDAIYDLYVNGVYYFYLTD